MAITRLEQNTVNQGMQLAAKLLDEVKPVLDELQAVYDAAGGVKETLDQSEMDDVVAFSGLTKQQLDDGMYALTATIRTAITDAYAQLSQLSARA